MNRPLRRLAALGLLGLGASTAGAQTFPKLFDVTYEASNLTLTITPTSNAASGNLPDGTTSYPMGAGVLFKNFFTSYPTSIVGQGGRLVATVGGGLRASTQSTDALLSSVYDQGLNTSGLTVLNDSVFGATFSLTKSDDAPAAFNTANSITITFTSSSASQYFSTTSSANAGYVNVGLGNGVDIGSYSYTYSAVPEPSTYAAIAGALGLGYAVYRRRRQAAAATA
ncbi:MAG: PEP-CTERM sorting domain-containing protein [Verrucomicrobia bacterium]|nr:PEP-CTERM sorting domain-containing protein [Verrucomicrobiota bacterium]